MTKGSGLVASVGAGSQPGVLRQRMADANLQHGDTVRTDILNVRSVPLERTLVGAIRGVTPRAEIRFCNMLPLNMKRLEERGDGGELPAEVKVEGIEFPGGANYDILGAIVSSNGSLVVRADRNTRIVERPQEALAGVGN